MTHEPFSNILLDMRSGAACSCRALSFCPLATCRNPQEIPWGESGADVVVEATGVFTTKDKVWTGSPCESSPATVPSMPVICSILTML